MHLQVRTDNHIENSDGLTERVRAEVESTLANRFNGRIQRVEVYFQDLNSHKGGVDKRCAIEARLAGHQPLKVEERATSIDEALSGAMDKLARVLDHTLERISDRHGRVSMSGNET